MSLPVPLPVPVQVQVAAECLSPPATRSPGPGRLRGTVTVTAGVTAAGRRACGGGGGVRRRHGDAANSDSESDSEDTRARAVSARATASGSASGPCPGQWPLSGPAHSGYCYVVGNTTVTRAGRKPEDAAINDSDSEIDDSESSVSEYESSWLFKFGNAGRFSSMRHFGDSYADPDRRRAPPAWSGAISWRSGPRGAAGAIGSWCSGGSMRGAGTGVRLRAPPSTEATSLCIEESHPSGNAGDPLCPAGARGTDSAVS